VIYDVRWGEKVNETVLQYWHRTTQYWNQLSRNKRITIGSSFLLFVIVMIVVIYSSSKTQYALAFTDLQPTDAKSITTYLDTAKISYQLSDDGQSIFVPKSKATQVKLDVESQGLNKSGSIGYDVFTNSSSFGMTDNEFEVEHLAALQGEMEQLINSNTAIAGSKVLIYLPDTSLFLPADGKQDNASASVVVQLKQGYSLDQSQIDTLYSLISHSIKNLPTDNITISDSNGNLLPNSKSGGIQSDSDSAASSQLAIKKAFEQDIMNDVKTVLGGVLGPNKVIPMVFANLNFDDKSSVQNLVTPVDTANIAGIPISSQESSSSSTSDGGTSGGVAGTGTTDVPGYPSTTTSGGKSTSEQTQKTVNLEVNHITNTIKSSPFIVTDLSLSVGIDSPTKSAADAITQPMLDSMQKILQSIVSAALDNSGKNLSDADLAKKVTIFVHPFAVTAPITSSSSKKLYTYIFIAALAVVIAAVGGYMVSRRRKLAEAQALAESAESAKVEFPTLDYEQAGNDSQVRKQLEQLARKKPDEFVNLLRTWLADE